MLDTETTNEYVENGLSGMRTRIEELLDGEALFLFGPLERELEDAIRADIDTLKQSKEGRLRERLIVLVETPGGYMTVVERISNVFRHYFKIVDFIIPNFAYSAGTVLVLSGDAIYMDFHSVLGPIDPQRRNAEGFLVPLTGYLHRYNALVEKSRDGTITDAESIILVHRFDQAELEHIVRSIAISKELVAIWLVRYNFKNLKFTGLKRASEIRKKKQERAEHIADVLADSKKWHVHGRGITMQQLQSEEIGVMIDDYGKNSDLNEAIHQYYDLLKDNCSKQDVVLALHSANGFKGLIRRAKR